MTLLFATAFLLFGCGSAGKKWDTTHAHEVKNGQSKAEIKGWFGEPYEVAPVSNPATGAVERWTYTHAFSVAGGSTTSETLVVDFDKDGKVCDKAYVKKGG